VQAAITAAGRQLPTDLPSPPTYRKVNPADSPILVMGVHSDSLPLTEVDDYADTILAQQMSQISGVAQVSIGGEQKPAVRVQIDPAKLATKGLTLEDIRGVLALATTNAAKGTLNGATRSFTIAANDQLAKASDYDDVVVAYRNGAAVRVPLRPGRYSVRPHRDDPRLGRGRRIHPRPHHRARLPGDLPVPAQSARDHHTEPRGAALAARRHHGHVSRGLQLG
jgi:hypothetical protein